jgi:hypothetical protein
MENYIGRKCKGFRFEHGTDGVNWNSNMEKYIGEIGVIIEQKDFNVIIEFQSFWWNYPISLIEPHLIPEIPEIPKLGEGIEMEVSDDGIKWHKKKVVAQMNDGSFLTTTVDTCEETWKYARPIPEVKKYTKEELIKIVGHDFEII